VVPRELLRATAEQLSSGRALKYNFLTDATCVTATPLSRDSIDLPPGFHPAKRKSAFARWLAGNDPVVDSLVPFGRARTGWSGKFSTSWGFASPGILNLRRILLS